MNSLQQSLGEIGYLTEKELMLVEEKLRFSSFAKGEFILQEGNVCQSIYFLLQGNCTHYFVNENGHDFIVDLYTAHEWMLDHQSFTTQNPSRNNIRAFDNCEVGELTAYAIHELIGLSPSFFRLGRLLEKKQYYDQAASSQTPEKKYIQLLTDRPDLIKIFPLKFIASYLQIAPETLSRIRKKISI